MNGDRINGKTPEEIKKGLECCADYGNCAMQGCPYYPIKDCGHDLYSDALAYIQQLESAQPKWISVEERLPSGVDWVDEYECEPAEYLVQVGNAELACVAMFDGEKFIPAEYPGIIEERLFASPVTHWMPLPEPPQEEP